jgi:hypothetical protein
MGYILYINLVKIEKLTALVEIQNTLIGNIYIKVKRTLSDINSVDRLGSFAADDETGFIFTDIKAYVDELKNYINRYITEQDTNGKNK